MLDLLSVGAPQTEADVLGNFRQDGTDIVRNRIAFDIQLHRHIAAADIEADATDRNMLLVSDHAAHRLRVPEMAIGAQHTAGNASDAHASMHLRYGLVVVLSENLEAGHDAAFLRCRLKWSGRLASIQRSPHSKC